MNGFINALQFITIIPLGRTVAFDPGRAVSYFPLVGVLLGTMLCIGDQVASVWFPSPVVAVIDVVFLIIITGAFHIDGLGDTADGLFSHRSREQALIIMKDSRIGVMALVTIVAALSLKWGGIHGLGENRALLLIIIPTFSRSSAIFGIRFLPYGRPEGGTGHGFFEQQPGVTAFWGLLLPLFISFFLGWQGLWLWLAFGGLTALLLVYYHKKMGCITGDMLGAMIEVQEAVLFLLASAGSIPGTAPPLA